MNEPKIITWNYTLPKNCKPIENFFIHLTTQLQTLQSDTKLHLILDAREVDKISMTNKMKMDAYWKRYKKLLNEKLNYTTLFVNNTEQKTKLEKIYKSGSSTTPYRIILESELSNYVQQQTTMQHISNETSNNVISN